MKKTGYIAIVMGGLFLASCTKQMYLPNDQSTKDISPEWMKSGDTPNPFDPTGGGDVKGGGTITDPNNDEDGGKPKSRK